jgi:uncharacterized lipoprotein YmbA
VVVPRYLRRSGIVTRVGPNELRTSDLHRWGEDLDHGLARVVAENLAARVPSSKVRAFPWRSPAAMDYRVAIDVERFERSAEGRVVLEARWSLYRGGESTPFAREHTSLVDEPASAEHAEGVAAMSRAAARLSEQIAAAIRADATPASPG